MKRTKKSKKGFTLIELIIVIAILAILALIAIPAFNAYRERSAIAADNASCKIVYDSLLLAKATLPATATTAEIETSAKLLLEGGAYPTAQEAGGTIAAVFTGTNVDYVTNGKTARFPAA